MYRSLHKRTKAILDLKVEFSRKDMEQNYRSAREGSFIKDFKACMMLLILINIVVSVSAAVNKSWLELEVSGGTTIFLVVGYFTRRYFNKNLQIALLIMILAYNVTRLVLVDIAVRDNNKSRLFFSGYGLASVQGVLLLRLVKVSHKVFGVFLMLVLRFLYISIFVDPGTFNIVAFLRHFFIDAFIIHTVFSQEMILRKTYQDSMVRKEELLKFKELLADYLPQSLVVLTYVSNNLLFFNNAFENIFQTCCNDIDLQSANVESISLKNAFNSFLVDPSTIREVKPNEASSPILKDPKGQPTLGEILRKLSVDDHLSDKTISLSASIIQKDKRRVFEVTVKKVKWDSEDAIAVLFNDITYQENLITLKLANINKDRVIATVSHELRTPLNGIIGILDITEKKVDNPEIADYLSLCKDNAHLLLSLVNSILDLQQISAGKLKLNPININIRKVFKNLAQLFHFQCRQKSISLDYEIAEEVSKYVFTDENRLKQIIINLIGNALKFTSKGGINIKVAPSPENTDCLRISVTDTGIGIKNEDLKHLFKMYSKIEDGESVNKNGVGLGLTISNALAILLNGDVHGEGIRVESVYGHGTKFYFDIQRNLSPLHKHEVTFETKTILTEISNEKESPSRRYLLPKKISYEDCQKFEGPEDYQEDDNENFTLIDVQSKMNVYTFSAEVNTLSTLRKWNRNFTGNSQLKKELTQSDNAIKLIIKQDGDNDRKDSAPDMHILIVDDNPFNLLVAQNLVQGIGYKIKTALGGQEAIDTVTSSLSEGVIFKVIFMDCQMPIMDGFEASKALKTLMKDGQIPHIPIVGWTANNSEEDVQRCYEAGMEGYISKPASMQDFIKVISKL